jgi:hypothetical protein
VEATAEVKGVLRLLDYRVWGSCVVLEGTLCDGSGEQGKLRKSEASSSWSIPSAGSHRVQLWPRSIARHETGVLSERCLERGGAVSDRAYKGPGRRPKVSERGAKMSMGYDHIYRSTFRGPLAALRGDVDGRGFGVDKLRRSALKSLKQRVRVKLCATPTEGSQADDSR